MNHRVKIVTLDRAFVVVRWLCDEHVTQMEAAGWTVKSVKEPPHELKCEECPHVE